MTAVISLLSQSTRRSQFLASSVALTEEGREGYGLMFSAVYHRRSRSVSWKGGWQMLRRLSNGERLSSVSAVCLFVFMFFHWFGVKATNTSGLLFSIGSVEPGRNAWEALHYIPIVLVVTSFATLGVAALRLASANRRPFIAINAVVAILGIASVLLIVFRIINPPIFEVERTITWEGTVEPPIILALLAAIGIVFGGCLAIYEEARARPSGEPIGEHGAHTHGEIRA